MPSQQPNENMDKALKAYAQKRRDDAPQMELDLATRNMLQAEVARTLAPVPVPAKARPRFAWWPQIIMGVAGCAAVAIALILWSPSPSRLKAPSADVAKFTVPVAPVIGATPSAAPSPNTATLAVSAPTAPVDEKVSTGVTPSSSFGEATFSVSASDSAKLEASKEQSPFYAWSDNSVGLYSATNSFAYGLDTGGATDAGRFKVDEALTHGIDKDGAMVVRNGGVATDSLSTFDVPSSSGFLATREPAPALAKTLNGDPSIPVVTPTPAPALTIQPGTLGLADRSRAIEKKVVAGENVAKNVAQQVPQANLRFFRIENPGQYRRNLNSPPLPKVLTNFAVQRNGSNVSVRDADGSLYNGNVVLGPESAALGKLTGYGGATPAFQNGNSNMPEDSFAFRVTGYNGKLKQKIIFTGNVTNVVVVTNVAPVGFVQQNTSTSQNQNAPQQQSAQQIQQNLLLNGRVQVGRNTEFEIQAAPTK